MHFPLLTFLKYCYISYKFVINFHNKLRVQLLLLSFKESQRINIPSINFSLKTDFMTTGGQKEVQIGDPEIKREVV